MKQYNLWKTKEMLKYFIKVSLWLFGIVMFVAIAFLKQPLTLGLVSTSVSGVSFLFVIIWTMFEKVFWKQAWVNKFLPIPFKTPIIKGRWEGTLIRGKTPHAFVIEIKQTFTTISCQAYSEHAHSNSLAAEIIYDEHGVNFQLIYYWKGSTTNTGSKSDTTNDFDGFTVLNITESALTGYYFTNRQPKQTHGQLNLNYRQDVLKSAF